MVAFAAFIDDDSALGRMTTSNMPLDTACKALSSAGRRIAVRIGTLIGLNLSMLNRDCKPSVDSAVC